MNRFLPTLSVLVFVVGTTAFSYSWHQRQIARRQPGGIEGQRMRAIEAAKKNGYSTYSYTTRNVPPPLGGGH